MRFVRRGLAGLALLCFALSTHAAPQTYTISTKLSRVNFNLAHQDFIHLFGTMKMAPGTLVFDNDDWTKSSVQVSLPTQDIDLGDAFWNAEVRDDDAWEKLFGRPEVSFRSTRVVRTDAANGVIYGDLTLAGVTKPVALQMHVNKIGVNQVSKQPSVGITATTTVKRSQFGLDAYMDLVGDDLAVQIQLEAWMGRDPEENQRAAFEAARKGRLGS